MGSTELFDVVIIGAGPAGTCAALRLLELGHRVALIEQHVFPRPQIGESLSAGVRNIFDYLGAGHLLNLHGYIDSLPAQVLWEDAKGGHVMFRNHAGGIIVDRGKLDQDMLQLAVSKGLVLFQPAKPEMLRKEGDHWKVMIRVKSELQELKTMFLLDSRGRSGSKMIDKIITAPPMVALYANTSSTSMPACTMIEAQQDGWLWGSPLPGGDFRMMAFFAPEHLRKADPTKLFMSRISSSVLFHNGLNDLEYSAMKSCVVLNYAHNKPWDSNYIRIGEAAFTLDPLSSTGVEKAMRFSLQTVIAINTILSSGDPEISRSYFEEHMSGSVIQHLNWTSGHYKSAWPEGKSRFWDERSQMKIMPPANKTAFYHKLILQQQPQVATEDNAMGAASWSAGAIEQLWFRKIRRSKQVSYVKAVCVENDRLQLKDAIKYPTIAREIAYIDNIAIFPLVSNMHDAESFGELIYSWSQEISFEKARDITLQLCNLGILEIN